MLFLVFRFHGRKFSAVLILLPKLRRKYGILKYVRIQILKNSYFIFIRSIDLPIHLSLFILSHCHSTLGTRYVALPPPQHFSSRSLNLTLPPYFWWNSIRCSDLNNSRFRLFNRYSCQWHICEHRRNSCLYAFDKSGIEFLIDNFPNLRVCYCVNQGSSFPSSFLCYDKVLEIYFMANMRAGKNTLRCVRYVVQLSLFYWLSLSE